MHRETRPASRQRTPRPPQTLENDWSASVDPAEWGPEGVEEWSSRDPLTLDDPSEVIADEPGPAPSRTLEGLSIAGITRRRVAWVASGVLSVWIVVLFARQVGDASAATGRADKIRESNVALATDVEARRRELELIQKQTFIVEQARAYQLGRPRERPFTLAPDAPPLGEDAPGSASLRLGARDATTSPLDSWLSLLFGSGQ